MELIDVLRMIAVSRGTTLEHEIMGHNVDVTERHMESGKPMPCATEEERVERTKAVRKRAVDKARVKRQAGRSCSADVMNERF